MSKIQPIGVNTETREQLLDRATRQRVEMATMRADLIRLEIYRERMETVEAENKALKKDNNRLASAVGRLNKKLELYTGKVEKKGKKGAKQDSGAAEPDNRADDASGTSGC